MILEKYDADNGFESLKKLKNSLTNSDKFIERAKKYTDLEALTPEILRTLIDKVIVHDKAVKYSRTANKNIEIHYRDIGYLADYTKETDIAEPYYDFTMIKTGELICVNKELPKIVA